MSESGRDSSQAARVFYLDADRRLVETRDVTFTSRIELLHQLERELDRCTAIEVWQGETCIMCLKAHGTIESNCGKPEQPTCCKSPC